MTEFTEKELACRKELVKVMQESYEEQHKDCIRKRIVWEAIEKERDICDKMATKVEGNDDFMFNQFKARILTCERLLQSLGLDGEQK